MCRNKPCGYQRPRQKAQHAFEQQVQPCSFQLVQSLHHLPLQHELQRWPSDKIRNWNYSENQKKLENQQSVQVRTMLTREIIAKTAESVITVVCTPFSTNSFARTWPWYLIQHNYSEWNNTAQETIRLHWSFHKPWSAFSNKYTKRSLLLFRSIQELLDSSRAT